MAAPASRAGDRAALRAAFLQAAGWGAAASRPLAGDASFRRYDRLQMGGTTAVLMDAPPGQEDVRPFLQVAGLLHQAGLSAPAVLAADEPQGFILLEDLGDALFTGLASDPEVEAEIYSAAVDMLAVLHARHPAEMPALRSLPPQDHGLLRGGLDTFLDWYWPAAHGAPASPALRQEFLDLWQPLLQQVRPASDDGADVLVMRDYHADNLIWLPARNGPARVGLLDFQDAVLGHPAYDLVSLLDDVRREVARPLAADLLRRYLRERGLADSGRGASHFEAGYAIFGAQRNIRILGVFVRLWRRDGKARYLDYLPRTRSMLDHALRHPALAEVAAWFSEHLPPEAGLPGRTGR
ncbi:MAG: phosphotransferase [Sneathiellaceae bacterium]